MKTMITTFFIVSFLFCSVHVQASYRLVRAAQVASISHTQNGLGQVFFGVALGVTGMHAWHQSKQQPRFSDFITSFKNGVKSLRDGDTNQAGKHLGKSLEQLIQVMGNQKPAEPKKD